MRFLLQLVLTILFSWLLQSFLPWWGAVVTAFIIGLLLSGNKGISSFFAGFLAVFLLWIGYAMIIDMNTQSILTERIARIFTINNKYVLILITGIIGGLPAGFGALTGNQLQKVFKKKPNSGYYS